MTVPNVKNLLLKSASVMATVLVQAYTKGFCAAKVSNLFFFYSKRFSNGRVRFKNLLLRYREG